MKREIKTFIERYSERIRNHEAALFIGAGVSSGSGVVNWKELLREVADEIGLDVDKESDLIEVAQYHKNKKGSRYLLNRKLISELNKNSKPNRLHDLILQTDIQDIWTTNYDTLIEDSFKRAKIDLSVKNKIGDLTYKQENESRRLYKMHGDIADPDHAVLTKDDYETYSDKWASFALEFKSALINKSFLFLGFSFDDPNLKLLLSRIKNLLGDKSRDHYCIMKSKALSEYLSDEEHKYAENKYQLKIDDLRINYGIQVITVDEYSQINDIIDRVNKRVKYNDIFVSGAADTYEPYSSNDVEKFVNDLSYNLVSKGMKITTGFGLGIGSSVINGALRYAFEENKKIDSVINMRPFPQNIKDEEGRKMLWTKYRKNMLSSIGIALFMFGNKFKDTEVVISDGMLEEYEIAVEQGIIVIPLGFTGYATKKIEQIVKNDFKEAFPDLYNNQRFIKQFEELSKSRSLDDKTISLIMETIAFIKRSSSI